MASVSSILLRSKGNLFPSNPNSRFYTYIAAAKTSSSCSREFSLYGKKSIGEIFYGIGSTNFNTRNANYHQGEGEILEEKEKEEVNHSVGRDRTTRVVEDSACSVVVWEQGLKDVKAERDRRKVTSPGFSFSAAGMLLPYHLGVAELLIERGYIKETTPLAGSSAGAIASVAIASGKSMQEALKATKMLVADCRLNGTGFRLGVILREFLAKFLPDDVHTRSNGRVRVAITQLLWRPRRLLVDQFHSKEDLINALFTSSFIPGYSAPRPATVFRNQLCIDGGLTLLIPPTSASETVCVCAFPASWLKLEGIGISPDCSRRNKATPWQLLKWSLEPADDELLDKFFELGYLDATVWAEQNPVGKIVHTDKVANSP